MRMRKEQVVIGSDFGQRKSFRLLCVIVKVMEELVDKTGMLLVMVVCFWNMDD
jgi:hypothetical protein